jgi:single-strand DNA-binding protein
MANLNVNKVIIGGRLTAEPELKTTQSGKSVCSFSIAVNRKIKQQGQSNADFFNVVAWSNNADTVARYFHKGSSICVVGSIQNRTWTDNNNQKHYATDIVADEVYFVDSKNESEGNNTPAQTNGSTEQNFGSQGYNPYLPSDDDKLTF